MSKLENELRRVIGKYRKQLDRLKTTQNIPANTCKLIDSVQGQIQTGYCSTVPAKMEHIRSANLGLREIGKDWYELARDLVDDLEMTYAINAQAQREKK